VALIQSISVIENFVVVVDVRWRIHHRGYVWWMRIRDIVRLLIGQQILSNLLLTRLLRIACSEHWWSIFNRRQLQWIALSTSWLRGCHRSTHLLIEVFPLSLPILLIDVRLRHRCPLLPIILNIIWWRVSTSNIGLSLSHPILVHVV
jgi:hypothetical protein